MNGFKENLWLAIGTINANKLRSVLTILGVVIGVTCVISIGGILTGFDRSVVAQIESFGVNNIFIEKMDSGPHFGRPSREERMRKPISYENFEAIKESCTLCKQVLPVIFGESFSKARHQGRELLGPDFHGSEANYPEVMNLNVAKGRMFTETEDAHSSPICVVGEDVVTTLFPSEDPLGKPVDVDGHSFEIIGVFEKKRQGSSGESSQDRMIVVPYETFRKSFPSAKEHFLVAQALPGRIDAAQDQVRQILRRSRRVKFDEPDSFGMATASSIIEQFHAITGATLLIMVVISSIGLLVGGVGVMNIMLVSVTERTREIGVRKALGARRRDITLQFLLEAVALTGLGGVMGLIGGYTITLIIGLALPGLPVQVPMWGVAAGLSVSISVGVFFGLWPAMKAARLDPVEALRYE
jgi:putative ABC transport system permease protein